MELNLQPQAATCFVSGQPFVEDARVVSHLVRSDTLEIMRYDVREDQLAEFHPVGTVVCHWVHSFKPRSPNDNPDRAMKLTAESLFLTLADPANELSPENTRLVQFLALMLERKKLLRPKGRNPATGALVYEHGKSKQLYAVPAGDMTPEFFMAVQQQLSILTGGGEPGSTDTADKPAT